MTDHTVTETLTVKNQPEPVANKEEPRITVHKIYTKAQQFAVNGLPQELSKNWAPQVSVHVNPRFLLLASGQHEVVLTFSLSVQQLGKVIFQLQLNQAGLFTLHNVSAEQKDVVLSVVCASALYPYAAVMINQALSQARLPHLYLNPTDFISSYPQHLEQEEEAP